MGGWAFASLSFRRFINLAILPRNCQGVCQSFLGMGSKLYRVMGLDNNELCIELR